MNHINLHTIFCHLVNDDKFLSTTIETNNDVRKKKNKKKGFNLMKNMVTEYSILAPHESQSYHHFPYKVKSFLTPNYVRLGIKNIIEKNLNRKNISFLNSLNLILRPELCKMDLEEQIKNFNLFEVFVCHKIQRNYQIDKTKNTRKIQSVNKELIKNLSEGEKQISHELIQYIINIFEINLLVFDFIKMDVYFYWSKGIKYPYLNLFKDIHCMSYIQGNYEPIIPRNTISEEQRQKMYLNILTNSADIICYPEIDMFVNSLIYLNTWDIDISSYITIIQRFFNKPFDLMEHINKINLLL